MTQYLDENSIHALVDYRIQRAKETLLEADTLIKDGYYNAAINRLYYACYYAVIALLVKNNITASTHHGVKLMFGLHFISTEKIDNKYSKFYSQLFNDRMSGDYDDFLKYDEAMIFEIRPLAEEFIEIITKELYSL